MHDDYPEPRHSRSRHHHISTYQVPAQTDTEASQQTPSQLSEIPIKIPSSSQRMGPLSSAAATTTAFILLLLIAGVSVAVPTSPVGVTYNPPSPTTSSPPPLSPEQVAGQLQRLGISTVSLPSDDPSVVRAFSYSNISILLTVPNSLIPSLASNLSSAAAWLYLHVIPFYPRARISTISVGSDFLSSSSSDSPLLLLPALRNLHLALHELGIRKISVSTTFSFLNSLTTSFPPSAAEFQDPAAGLLIKPLLQFLDETNSSFLINLHPYHVYRANPDIPLGFALFQESPFSYRDDPITGVRYRNLYDTMLDSVITAMAVAGHENIPVIVAETGWPCLAEHHPAEVDANQVFAEMFLRGLIRHLKSSVGTPLRSQGGLGEVYVYELFDSHSHGDQDQRSWGIFYPNMTSKYRTDFTGSSSSIINDLVHTRGVVILVNVLVVLFA